MKKRILYAVLSVLLYAMGIASAFLMYFYAKGEFGAFYNGKWAFVYPLLIGLLNVVLPLSVLLHECGHLLFGLACGNRFVRFTVYPLVFGRDGERWRVRFSFLGRTAGETSFYPTKKRGVKIRYLLTAAGGAAANLLYAALFGVFYFILPHSPALIFFEVLAPLSLAEGLSALLPAELPAGKTDGAVLFGLLRGAAEEEVSLRVLTAQGILFRGTFEEVPRPLLFDCPVVREDLPAFRALLLFRAQYALRMGEEETARQALGRLCGIEELGEEERAEAERYAAYFTGGFRAERQTLYGFREAEEKIAARAEDKKRDPASTGSRHFISE